MNDGLSGSVVNDSDKDGEIEILDWVVEIGWNLIRFWNELEILTIVDDPNWRDRECPRIADIASNQTADYRCEWYHKAFHLSVLYSSFLFFLFFRFPLINQLDTRQNYLVFILGQEDDDVCECVFPQQIT